MNHQFFHFLLSLHCTHTRTSHLSHFLPLFGSIPHASKHLTKAAIHGGGSREENNIRAILLANEIATQISFCIEDLSVGMPALRYYSPKSVSFSLNRQRIASTALSAKGVAGDYHPCKKMPERRREKYEEGDHVSSAVIRGLGKGFVDFFLFFYIW